MSRVEAYRRRAGECLALAKSVTGCRERQLLIKMAVAWHELAESLRRFIDEHKGEESEFCWGDQPSEEKPSQ
jgi:hypothetical protein